MRQDTTKIGVLLQCIHHEGKEIKIGPSQIFGLLAPEKEDTTLFEKHI
jgi:hypothetical protein